MTHPKSRSQVFIQHWMKPVGTWEKGDFSMTKTPPCDFPFLKWKPAGASETRPRLAGQPGVGGE